MLGRFKSNLLVTTIFLLGIGIFIITTLRLWAVFPQLGNPSQIGPHEGALAPDFNLLSVNGEQVRLSELRGRTILINFWATWCGPCIIEMPVIETRFQKYTPELVVLAVNFDEPMEDVKAFVDELGLTFTVLLDPGAEIQKKYRIRGYPTTFIVDEEGIIQVQNIGVMTEGQLDRYLELVGVIP
jgi:peroxiredoxin